MFGPLKPISIHTIFEDEENNSNPPHDHFVDTRAYPGFLEGVRQGRLAWGGGGETQGHIQDSKKGGLQGTGGRGVEKLTYT